MHDPFEESLRDLLKASPSGNDRDDLDDAACLGRVLKTANRQVARVICSACLAAGARRC